MNLNRVIGLLSLVFTSCSGNTDALNPLTDTLTNGEDFQADRLPFQQTDTLMKYTDSLNAYFENPFDFYALKEKTMHMHTGHARDFKEDYFKKAPDLNYHFYCYWALEFDLHKNTAEPSLVFATWKPWGTSVEKSYSTDNEILVGVRCRISWPEGLQRSDFVGKSLDEIKYRFGEPKHTEKNCMIYPADEKLLILHTEKEKVDWFKFFLTDTSQIDHSNLPAEFLEFSY